MFALTLVAAFLLAATLACTSNDTLFIHLTATPAPTITPTPLAILTKFKIGDTGVLVSISAFRPLQLPALPGALQPGIAGNVTCFPGSKVTILDVSKSLRDPNDPTIYYQVACPAKGWAADYQLARFAANDSAVIQVSDAPGATLYSAADKKSQALPTPCANGTTVSVQSVTSNPSDDSDQTIYLQVSCGSQSGYVVESALAPAP
jgi:hypothetical protein